MSPAREAADRPNILFIMADDHAANAIGTYGAHLAPVAPTENIDRIARDGARLDNCVCTNSICTPSRASILTGQHSHRNGVRTLNDALDPDSLSLASRLQTGGYQTAVMGKWHLESRPAGFDDFAVLPGQGRYRNPQLIHEETGWDSKEAVEHDGYSTDVITDHALEWLGDTGEPFFLMCNFKAPHEPWIPADRHSDLLEGAHIPEPPSLFEDRSHRSPATRDRGSSLSPRNPIRNMVDQLESQDWPTGPLAIESVSDQARTRAAYQKHLTEYLRCVAAIDENVGRLLDYLDTTGVADDTLVIYTSDQGMFLGEHDHIDKRWMYEESLQMPLLARYPGVIPADSFVDELIANIDFAPTLLDYAGLPIPDAMQGRSCRSILSGDSPADWRDSVYYRYWMHRAHHDVPAHYGLRTSRYKLIFFYGLPLDAAGATQAPTDPGWELYDLKRDPHETNNVFEDPHYRSVREDLMDELSKRKQAVGDTDDEYPELMSRIKQFDRV